MKMQPQAALEQAACELIWESTPPDGFDGYDKTNCRREPRDKPPPSAPHCFVAVWSDNARTSQGRTDLDEIFHFFVTITLRSEMPYDEQIGVRDEIEARANFIRAALHKDSIDYRLIRRAMLLAGLTWNRQTTDFPVGWTEASMFAGMDAIREQGPAWFSGKPDSTEVGFSQQLRFDKARWLQAIPTEV